MSAKPSDAPTCCCGDRVASVAHDLRHDSAHFQGLSTRQAERRRAEIFAGVVAGPLTDEFVANLKEELKTSISPLVLAGAARALRFATAYDSELLRLLNGARERIAQNDEYIRFSYDAAAIPAIRASEELAMTISILSSAQQGTCDCASARTSIGPLDFALAAEDAAKISIEDQAGLRHRLDALLNGRRALIAFFYTRCMNPDKCSLTITRLAAVAKHLAQTADVADTLILACSYDPDFDRPDRLEAYGRARSFPFDGNALLVRCVGGWDTMRAAFRLRVGYSASTVNDHARELFWCSPDLISRELPCEILALPQEMEAILRMGMH
jgi:protein SCO1/2